MLSLICQVLSCCIASILKSQEAGMTVIELTSSKSDPAENAAKTIVDLVDALDHQVILAN